MKKEFFKPEAKIVKFAARDIITTSTGTKEDKDENEGNVGGYTDPTKRPLD